VYPGNFQFAGIFSPVKIALVSTRSVSYSTGWVTIGDLTTFVQRIWRLRAAFGMGLTARLAAYPVSFMLTFAARFEPL